MSNNSVSPLTFSAVLASVRLTKLPQRAKDADLSTQVAWQHGASDKSGYWSTDLWPDGAIEPISKMDSVIRRYFLDQTLPWADRGARLLPQKRFMEYSQKLQQLQIQRDQLIDEFVDNYDSHVAAAQRINGALFHPECYPTRHDARKKFNMSADIQPIPVSDDFRIQASVEHIEKMKASLQSKIDHAEKIAVQGLVERMMDPLNKLVTKLTEPSNGDKGPIFRDSLIYNVRDVMESVAEFNVMDDPRLEAIAKKLNSVGHIGSVDPDMVRESPELRQASVQQAEQFLGQLQEIFGNP